ncbi:MAG: DUF6519 domain-containing protein, partial [Anaerolineae bacterium]
MKGDFTRDTFDPRRHFSRVLMQQGRVQLDADWNEQASIQLHYLRTLAADLIGPHGGPAGKKLGFEIAPSGKTFTIGPGRYYVRGIPCQNDMLTDELGRPIPVPCTEQPGYPFPDSVELEPEGRYLVYLDVWERHVTYVVEPDIREVALGVPDTATRAQIVWQVKTAQLDEGWAREDEEIEAEIEKLKVELEELHKALEEAIESEDADKIKEIQDQIAQVEERLTELLEATESEAAIDCTLLLLHRLRAMHKFGTGAMRARAYVEETPDDPCIIQPQARYRGAENQLYRVEIHKPGQAEDATFKWSRDNGSVIFPILSIESDSKTGTTTVALEHLGHDDRFSLQIGDWVEVIDDDIVLRGSAEPLLRVTYVDRVDMKVTLEGTLASSAGEEPKKHPLLRRWDQKVPTVSDLDLKDGISLEERKWLDLEDGIQIWFGKGGRYKTGDYWLIPARTATGDVEWPGPSDDPAFRRPHGVRHYYAPLWRISTTPQGNVQAAK